VQHASFNRCNLPAWIIASWEFNDDPRPLELQGVHAANAFLFRTLDTIDDPDERARRFDDWLSVRFQLHQWRDQVTELARKSLRNGYLRFLRGWAVDAGSIEGAVLKGWVESRLGIPPTFHHEPIESREGEAYVRYLRDRMDGMARTSAIQDQLDLVYTFTQYELARRHPGERWLTLYRGQHDAGAAVCERLSKDEHVVRLNNVCSFTDEPERAWEFGTTVWQARVACPRVFCASWLFPRSMLRSEREVLVIGGEMKVRRVR
jgi:NAD+--dinitrogen-reductase ADP-D-ribosyltransferase